MKIAAALTLLLMAGAAHAGDLTERQRCLQAKVQLTYAHLEYGDFGRAFVEVYVTNNLPYAISAAEVAFSITTPGREAAWVQSVDKRSFEGGIEPGEQRKMLMLGEYLPEGTDGKPLEVTAKLVDVANTQGELAIAGNAPVSCHVNPPTGEDM